MSAYIARFNFGKTAALISSTALVSLLGAASAQTVPILQPGAPGEAVRTLTAAEAAAIADTSYTLADVRFMQDMIPHHQQAVEMAALVAERTNNQALMDVSGRIDASQADEIAFMQDWLKTRNQTLPGVHTDHATHMRHDMMGMASPAQMADLAAANGAEFDTLFLNLMITHHEGAVSMVDTLLDQKGSAYDPVLFEFVNDVLNDQTAEIERMNVLLEGLSSDPRAGLAAGFDTAEEAIFNLVKLASLPKPPGFFDPENPAGLPNIIPQTEDAASNEGMAAHHMHSEADDALDAKGDPMDMATSADEATPQREEGLENGDTKWDDRSPLLVFDNTDMAFAGDRLVVGNYHGFNIYRLSDDAAPELISSVVCPGGQGDVSIVGDLLIMSVEQTRGRVDCGRQGISEDVSAERFRGLRIFDISDPRRPLQVGQVQTCRGSHTHSVVSGPDETGLIVVYNSGTASIREDEELEGCVGSVAGDNRTALFRIDVIEIPVNAPHKARIVDSPAVFADSETGQIAGLWQGGDHGEETQDTNRTDHCHDITVFPEKQIAAGACSGNGVIFDISDPLKPKRIDAVLDQKFAYWHSATFNNDGTKVLFTDEWGGGSRPRCRPSDPLDWGANAIYDIVDGKLEFRSHFKMPAPQSEQENCVAHNGAVVPVPGRDIFVQAWYQGGLSVIDFTDSAHPKEIAYFDRGPIHADTLMVGGYWSTYWYDGKIYGTEMVRGLDVFALQVSDQMSAAEIAAAQRADQGEVFNPQQQFSVTWPTGDPVIAQAYIDQLKRDRALLEPHSKKLEALLEDAEAALLAGRPDRRLAARLRRAASQLSVSIETPLATGRGEALQETLEALAERVSASG